jgi:predicted RNase H-like HicB family nuclease
VEKAQVNADTVFYTVNIHPCVDTVGYWAECAMQNGGCTVQADTLQETQKSIMEAVEFYLEDYPDVLNYLLVFSK